MNQLAEKTEKLYFIDLFAGAGGLSEGFIQAGFYPIAHVEMNEFAAKTLVTRSAYYYLRQAGKLSKYYDYMGGRISREALLEQIPKSVQNTVLCETMSDESLPAICKKIDGIMKIRGINKVDVIIGGPPCQAYSLVGRAQSKHMEVPMSQDPRNKLYILYGRMLKKYKPRMFVFENVMGIESANDGATWKNLKKYLRRVGYEIECQEQNAKSFGVLQNRRRMIIMASFRIPEKLSQLETTFENKGCLDTAIATNMIAVGMDVDRLGLMAVTGQPKQNSEYIQATSRIGRSHPGLVVTLYNAYRPRDLSHYENFTGYHAQLYRFVEGTTATPFSARARDRVLHALVISAIRLNYPQMANNPDAATIVSLTDEQIATVRKMIIDRLNIVKPSAIADAEDEINQFIEWWKLRASRTDKPLRYYVVGTDRYNRLMNPYDKPHEEDEKATLQSMREVESSANMFYYTEE